MSSEDWLAWAPTITAVVALAAGAVTTWASLSHQRRLETDKRLWEKRADLYVDLLAWFTTPPEVLTEGARMERPDWMPPELEARSEAFSSGTVTLHVLQVRDALRDWVADRPLMLEHDGEVTEAPHHLRYAWEVEKLRMVIRKELQGEDEWARHVAAGRVRTRIGQLRSQDARKVRLRGKGPAA